MFVLKAFYSVTTPVSVRTTPLVSCVPTLLPVDSVRKVTFLMRFTVRPVLYPSVVTAIRMAHVLAALKASYSAVTILVFVLKASH